MRVAKLGQDALMNETQRRLSISNIKQSLTFKDEDQDVDNFNLNAIRVKDPARLFWIHFCALSLKRFRYFKRDKKGLICELVVPFLLALVGLLLSLILFARESDPVVLSPSLYKTPFRVMNSGSLD